MQCGRALVTEVTDLPMHTFIPDSLVGGNVLFAIFFIYGDNNINILARLGKKFTYIYFKTFPFCGIHIFVYFLTNQTKTF